MLRHVLHNNSWDKQTGLASYAQKDAWNATTSTNAHGAFPHSSGQMAFVAASKDLNQASMSVLRYEEMVWTGASQNATMGTSQIMMDELLCVRLWEDGIALGTGRMYVPTS